VYISCILTTFNKDDDDGDLTKRSLEFHQIYNLGAVWDKVELTRF